MSNEPDLDLGRAFAELDAAGVDYVVIGAVAAGLYGSTALTGDLDICYGRDRDNVEALASVLRGLHARLRGAPPDLKFRLDARTILAGDSFTFVTDAGDLDILATPSGTGGYPDLAKGAQLFELDGINVRAASLEDLMRMKRAAGRPKDLFHLEILAALLDEIDEDS